MQDLANRADRLLRESLVWDNHGCMPVGRPHDTSFLPELQRYRRAGIDVVTLNIGFGEMGIESHIRTLAGMRHWLKSNEDGYVLVETPADIESARRSGRLAVCFDIEGANAIADQPSLIQLYFDLGVRWMLLAYNRPNLVGGGCQEHDPGLTPYGREVVREMERVGMIVCCSHTGHRTARDVFGMASRPVIFSHSNPAGVHPHPRNVPDELLDACAATGGVVGINGIGTFLGPDPDAVKAFARHIDYVVQRIGPEHVALGTDYVFDVEELNAYVANHPQMFPESLGYERNVRMLAPEQLKGVIKTLLSWDYGDEAIQGLLGGNLVRVAAGSWRNRNGRVDAVADDG